VGRENYAVETFTDFLKAQSKIPTPKWLVNLIREIIRYENDRVTWNYKDTEKDLNEWLSLKEIPTAEYNSGEYAEKLEYALR
jgi:hypothetical protein